MRGNDVSACRNDIHYANETKVVCFVQRIEIYYPENCPYCHSCPYNIVLGDTFGPLEVVGFGHAGTNEQHQQHMCAPCNVASKIRTAATASLSCSQIQQCHESVDCSTGTSLGIPSYTSNQCSFQNPFNDEDDLVQEDSFTDDDNVGDDDSVTNPDTDDDDNDNIDEDEVEESDFEYDSHDEYDNDYDDGDNIHNDDDDSDIEYNTNLMTQYHPHPHQYHHHQYLWEYLYRPI